MIFPSPPSAAEAPTGNPLDGCRQLVLVIAPAWDSSGAHLQRFERHDVRAGWRPAADRIPVSLGRAGLAWGLGRHPEAGDGERRKREGDGRSPAGIFAIPALFGDPARDAGLAAAAGLPYLSAGRDLICVDDPASRHYNRVLDRRGAAAADWQSHEDMLRADERYTVGAVIAHNADPPRPGAGSCIFLHVWQAPGVPTAGCTAGEAAAIAGICRWLRAEAQPLFVQLPYPEYLRHRQAWRLP